VSRPEQAAGVAARLADLGDHVRYQATLMRKALHRAERAGAPWHARFRSVPLVQVSAASRRIAAFWSEVNLRRRSMWAKRP
jgi:hypothetical protein